MDTLSQLPIDQNPLSPGERLLAYSLFGEELIKPSPQPSPQPKKLESDKTEGENGAETCHHSHEHFTNMKKLLLMAVLVFVLSSPVVSNLMKVENKFVVAAIKALLFVIMYYLCERYLLTRWL